MAAGHTSRRKPGTSEAMRLLIAQVRDATPSNPPDAQVCTAICNGCSIKLLDNLDLQLTGWQERLAAGDGPTLAGLSRLAGISRKVCRALARNGLIAA